jgi:hypothetical protein
MEQKPIILEMDEAKQELIQCVNDIMRKHGVNCYLMEPAFAELYAEVKATAQRELAQARAQETAKQGATEVAPTIQND